MLQSSEISSSAMQERGSHMGLTGSWCFDGDKCVQRVSFTVLPGLLICSPWCWHCPWEDHTYLQFPGLSLRWVHQITGTFGRPAPPRVPDSPSGVSCAPCCRAFSPGSLLSGPAPVLMYQVSPVQVPSIFFFHLLPPPGTPREASVAPVGSCCYNLHFG